MVSPKVIFRVDGGKGIGYGHLNRCLALAQAFKSKGFSLMLITSKICLALDSWSDQGIEIINISCESGKEQDTFMTKEIVQQKTPSMVVVDGYSFNENYQKALLSNKYLFIYLDDTAETNIFADVVVNQSPGAEIRYKKSYPYVRKVFLGSSFTLLRNEVTRPISDNQVKVDKHILVTFGGDDFDGLSVLMVKELLKTEERCKVKVIIDPTSINFQKVELMVKLFPGRLDVLRPSEIAPLLERASVLITAGGTTVLEALYFGVPTVVVTTASNQEPGIKFLSNIGAVLYAGMGKKAIKEASILALMLLSNLKMQKLLKVKGSKIIDGQGVERVIFALGEVKRHPSINSREAN